ncbi:hypothetical protein JXJ21_19595 [candidate division KSB1 bacterium]|nr:hypothetical protein [candidate division KSB1 bacterium]
MNTKILSALFVLLCVLNCTEDNPVEPEKTVPVLSLVSAADTLFLSWDQAQEIVLKVEDPQGVQDVKWIACEVFESATEEIASRDTLRDDGTNGDVVAGDGIFIKILNTALTGGKTGLFLITFQAEDREGNLSNEIALQLTIVRGVKNKPPVIESVIAPDSVDISIEQTIPVECSVSDPEGPGDIERVVCEIYQTTDLVPFLSDTLADDGTGGDAVANDGNYTFLLNSNFAGDKIRQYYLSFRAYDLAGNESVLVRVLVQTYKLANHPPVITNLVAPDTMSVPAQGAAETVLTVDVTDPEGRSDIRDVYMNVYKPDGSGSSLNPLSMEDDGGGNSNSGDEVAGDGTYSLGISLPTGTVKGIYTFIFEAVDYSNARSNQIIHKILVK